MSSNFDSIFALASPSQRSAIHLHRISGRNLFEILSKFVYKPSNQNENLNIDLLLQKSNGKAFSHYVYLKDHNLNLIDDVKNILLKFKENKILSYDEWWLMRVIDMC